MTQVESKEREVPPRPKWKFTEGIVVALAAPLAYDLAYEYERGYASFFKIPVTVVSVTLQDTVRAATVLFAATLVLLMIFNFLMMILPARIKTEKAFYPAWPLLSIWIAFLIFGGGLRDPNVQFATGFFAFVLFMYFGLPAFSRKGTYVERLISSHAAEAATINRGLFARFPTVIESNTLTLLWLLPVLPALAFVAGRAEARKQVDFPVSESDAAIILLAKYDDLLVLGHHLPGKAELEPTFTLIKVGSGDSHTFRNVNLGPFLETSLSQGTAESKTVDTPTLK